MSRSRVFNALFSSLGHADASLNDFVAVAGLEEGGHGQVRMAVRVSGELT